MKKLEIVSRNVKPSKLVVAFGIVQEKIRDPKVRKLIARLLTINKRRTLKPEVANQVEKLNDFGYLNFPKFLNEEKVVLLRSELEKMLCIDPWRKDLAEFSADKPPVGTHVAHIPEAATLDVLHEIATNELLVDIITGYFGAKPVLDSIQAWWSYPSGECAQEAELFHRDNESIRFLKFFIYMTDVDDDSGPHVFVKGSAVSNKVTGLNRYSDEEVLSEYGAEAVKVMLGHAGDAFLEDTFGIHKGLPPKNKRRLLVQFRYSVYPTIFRSKIIVNNKHFDHKKIDSLVC